MSDVTPAKPDETHELLPCPHCGKSDRLKVVPYRADDDGEAPFDWGFMVQCSARGFSTDDRRGCGSSGGWGETQAEAVAAWNQRASPSVSREAGWQPIDSAPVACHMLLTYWSEEFAEWIVWVEMRPFDEISPWTHWRPLPAPPSPEHGERTI